MEDKNFMEEMHEILASASVTTGANDTYCPMVMCVMVDLLWG